MKPPEIVGITRSLVLDDKGSPIAPENFIAYVARVSNPSNQMNDATAPQLLTFLVKQGHWSPFDMVDLIVRVETSKAIAIQGLRHWSFRFQEFSMRYSEVSELDFSHVEARRKAVGGNRQGSAETDEFWSGRLEAECDHAALVYQEAVADGIAPESARMVLPLATPTTLYFKGSVRSWMTYFWQRCDAHAQKEHRELATQIFRLFCAEFPHIGKLVATHKPKIVEGEWMPEGEVSV